MVVVVDTDQVAELQVTSGGGSLGSNTLHGATITEEEVGVVVNKVEGRLVVDGGGVSLGDGETDGVGETLAERTSGDLDTWGIVGLWVTWGDAVDGTEGLDVVHGDAVAEEVEESILEHAAVSVAVGVTKSAFYPIES